MKNIWIPGRDSIDSEPQAFHRDNGGFRLAHSGRDCGMKKYLGFVAFVCFYTMAFTGCGLAPRKVSSESSSYAIHVKRIAGEDAWAVTYKLPKPVGKLVFRRQTSQFRREHWKVITPNVSIALIDGKEALISDREFDEVQFKIASYYESTPSDYEFFFGFSDGSLMMYTGHFLVRGYDTASYTFEGRPGETVVILGRVINETVVKWDDTLGEGTYVYFGKIKPFENKRLTAVIDPGMPQWLRDGMLKVLPRLIDFYASKTGVPLDFKPVVFFNFEPSKAQGWSQTGGTLPGLVHLSIKGDPKTKSTPKRTQELYEWLAHEMAHFWNGRMFTHDDGANWMHEGGADGFKHRALLALKLTTPVRVAEAHNIALNECVDGLQGISLDQTDRERRFRNHYHCGMILALLTERVIHEKASVDLFEFWRRLFARAAVDGTRRIYSEEMYFKLIDELTGDSVVSRRLLRLIHEKSDHWSATFQSVLEESGLSVKTTLKPVSSEATRMYGRRALREVMAADCDAKYGLTSGAGVYATDTFPSCKAFNVPMSVATIEGHDLFNAGHLAYDSVYEKCAAVGVLNVEAVTPVRKTLRINCTKPIAKREPQLRIEL